MSIHKPVLSQSSGSERQNLFLLHTQHIRESLGPEQIAERVHMVLCFMKSVNINLPILLWAISWNIPELISDPQAAAEHTALMISDELLGILAYWCQPPQKHSVGIRTKAAYDT